MRKISFIKKIRNILIAFLAYTFYYIFYYLVPLNVASKLGYVIGYYLLPKLKLKNKHIFLKNIAFVFPEKSKKEIGDIYRWSCVNAMQTFFELPKLRCMKKFLEIEDPYNLYDVIIKKQPSFIAVTAHFGNWELLGLPFLNLRGYAVYKAPSNKYVNDLFLRMRLQKSKLCTFKMITLDKNKLVKLMNEGKKDDLRLIMLLDQKVKDGKLVNFLGRLALTTPIPATFALKYNLPIIPVKVTRVFKSKKLKFIISIEKPINVENLENNPEDILKVTKMINDKIGEWIRNDPKQWLWLYDRWPK